jgi:CubicO group peptidase (beta-lactamase class C family)
LASLTKPLATVTAVAYLLEAQALRLDDRVGDWLAEVRPDLRAATLSDLLHHRAGLLAFSEQLADGLKGNPEQRLRALRFRVVDLPLKHPRGHVVYSDLGFMLLAWICQRAGAPVDGFRRREGLPNFVVPALDEEVPATLFVPSGRDEQGLPLVGRVHDPTCRRVGGMGCGHAGWFGTIEATAQAARHWLDLAMGRPSPLPESARALIAHGPHERSAGFDVPTPGGTTGGGWGPRSFGHLGYTGTAMWVDPDADHAAVLLTNRTWPDGTDRGIASLRRQFFGAVARPD